MKPKMRGKTVREIKMLSLTSLQISKRTGATLRQLQWWDEMGYLVPEFGIIGNQRRYSFSQETKARKITQLRQAGVSLKKSRRLLELDWTTVQPVAVPMLVNGVLLVPSLYLSQPEKNIRKHWEAAEKGRLNALALRDPSIAAGRRANA